MDDTPPIIQEIINGDALGMGAAARKVPAFRGEGKANPSTVWRWIVGGVKAFDGSNVKLEAARIGGRWMTSTAALARFFVALTPSGNPGTPAPTRTDTQREHARKTAHQRLEQSGC